MPFVRPAHSLRFVVVATALAALPFSACECTPAEGEGEGEEGEGEEGEGEEGEGEGEGGEVTICDAVPVVDGGGNACGVQAGAGGLLVVGDVLTPGNVFVGGSVAIDDDGTISCVGCACNQLTERTIVACPDAVVSPGFINAHDHAGWMNDQPWVQSLYNDDGNLCDGTACVDPNLRWEHRHDWRTGRRSHPEIDPPGGANTEAKMLGELRFVLGGATSTLASGGANGFLRNLDDSDDMDLIGSDFVDYETFPLGDSNGSQLDSGCAYPEIRTPPGFAPYAPHIAEGIDVEARNEMLCLSSAEIGRAHV